jgi:hypothetical protein
MKMRRSDVNTGRQSSSQSPVVYAVGNEELMEMLGKWLSEVKGLSCRTFTDADALFEEFASARPRPAVLITGCLDSACTGLRLIEKCKKIEPRLKVVMWSGHLEETLASLLARIPVIPDAIFRKGSEFDTERFLNKIEELVRGSGTSGNSNDPRMTGFENRFFSFLWAGGDSTLFVERSGRFYESPVNYVDEKAITGLREHIERGALTELSGKGAGGGFPAILRQAKLSGAAEPKKEGIPTRTGCATRIRSIICCPVRRSKLKGFLPVADGLQNPLKSLATKVQTIDSCPDAKDVRS